MGRVYTANGAIAAVTAATDMIRISAPSDAVLLIKKVVLTQETEFADAQAEQLDVLFHRGTTDGSGGAGATISPHSVGDPAFGGTAVTGNTTQSTPGAILWREGFHVGAGLQWQATPEDYFEISPSGRFVVELATAPDDSLDLRISVTFEELGG